MCDLYFIFTNDNFCTLFGMQNGNYSKKVNAVTAVTLTACNLRIRMDLSSGVSFVGNIRHMW